MKLETLTKQYYSIGEVSELMGVATSLIRYWETEFSFLTPAKNSKGERRYTPRDIEKLIQVYTLVKEDGYTIDGAKKQIALSKNENKDREVLIKKLTDLKKRLAEFKDSLYE